MFFWQLKKSQGLGEKILRSSTCKGSRKCQFTTAPASKGKYFTLTLGTNYILHPASVHSSELSFSDIFYFSSAQGQVQMPSINTRCINTCTLCQIFWSCWHQEKYRKLLVMKFFLHRPPNNATHDLIYSLVSGMFALMAPAPLLKVTLSGPYSSFAYLFLFPFRHSAHRVTESPLWNIGLILQELITLPTLF